MTPATYLRKAFKKTKHSRYRKCEKCGGLMVCRMMWSPTHNSEVPAKRCNQCGDTIEVPWTGGEIGKRIPKAE